MSSRLLGILVCTVLAVPLTLAAHGQPSPDPFMGDWQGKLVAADGAERPICAQVIPWGKEEYQANLLDAFDERVPPLAVLRGKLADGAVTFSDTTRIGDGRFVGSLEGDRGGAFEMQHVERLSPTLGQTPPAGAIVLFDGTGFDEWSRGGQDPWVVNLGQVIGGDNRVAYLRCRVWSPRAQPARLEMGSDDALKAWVNGRLVHSNLANRPVRAWEDRADIQLAAEWNTVLLKIVQGGGGWGACARIRSRDDGDLEDLRFEPVPTLPEGTSLSDYQGGSRGTILTWEVSGPYMEEGKQSATLFDTAFAPEQEGAAGVGWRLVNEAPQPRREWKLVEGGAMEIAPGSGTMVCNRPFADHKLHLEFRTPYEPGARGQGRGNSGVYLQNRYEVQILDSYGLEGRDNECGEIYGVAAPLVNMCAPPLQWQTFDIEFTAARFDRDTNQVQPARMTVYHNGVRIHDNVEIPVRSTGGQPIQTGGVLLQDHGNPVQFRNIWVLEQ